MTPSLVAFAIPLFRDPHRYGLKFGEEEADSFRNFRNYNMTLRTRLLSFVRVKRHHYRTSTLYFYLPSSTVPCSS